MLDQKEAYHYENYVPHLAGAKITIHPGMTFYNLRTITPYKAVEAMADSFREGVKSIETSPDFDDFFQQKIELSDDRINLVLSEMRSRDQLKYDNLNRLYDDLFRVSQWRVEIPFPQNYAKDKTWSDLNKSELQIRDQIRRELKDSAKDMAFPQKDLRESLLEFKLQSQKSKMMDLGSLDEIIEPDGSYKNTESDMHYNQNQT
jgi:hypothetical protein